VAIPLDQRAFAYWDHGWRTDPGQFVIYVGDSSEHTPLSVTLDVEPGRSAAHGPSHQ
jgi:beta-glucosidase